MNYAICPAWDSTKGEACGGRAELMPNTHHFYNRVYQCKRCNAIFGSPTIWFRCKLKGVCGADEFNNDCKICENYPEHPDVLKCPWFIGKLTLQEWEKAFPHMRAIDFEPPKVDLVEEARKLRGAD